LRNYEQSLSPVLLRLKRKDGVFELVQLEKAELLLDEHTRTAYELFDFANEVGKNPGASNRQTEKIPGSARSHVWPNKPIGRLFVYFLNPVFGDLQCLAI
jgi:hypothetical protein